MDKNLINSASVTRIRNGIETLAGFNSTPGEGVTRVALSAEDLAGRIYIKREMEALGLEVREDSVGNIFGTFPGTDRSLAPVWTGSHLDTVRNGGPFDGMAGVVCGLEAVRALQQSGLQPRRDISVVVYTSEEPTRYGMGCIGSRALAGRLTLETAAELRDDDGISLKEKLEELGYDLSAFSQIPRHRGEVYASVELHIEQGEVLERSEKTIGIVHTISAPTEMHVTITGRQSHAGATPMELRHDPMAASAAVILELERLASSYSNPSTVGTVGKIQVYPNSSNVIPGKVEFSVDIRSSSFEEKSAVLEQLQAFFLQQERQRGVQITSEVICSDRPACASPDIITAIREACESFGYSSHYMASGAYHDSMLISEFTPFGMIFLPSKDGISHDRREWTEYTDLEKGTNVLAQVLWTLSCQ